MKGILITLNSKKWHRKERAGVDENGNLPTKGRIQQQQQLYNAINYNDVITTTNPKE